VIALHRRQGDEVHVVVASDGERGDAERRYPADGYVALRRDECRRATRALDAAEPIFLGLPDQGVSPGALRAPLVAVLERLRPEIVYHPPALEMHPDHHAVGEATVAAVRSLSFAPRCFAYETWVPVVPTHVIDVSAVWPVKQAALAEYASQLAYNDYRRATSGLAAYRTMFLPGARFVEAFAETTPARSRLRRALRVGGRQ
jgi:LmbE family N-acetylglucosaminyl deacetylase